VFPDPQLVLGAFGGLCLIWPDFDFMRQTPVLFTSGSGLRRLEIEEHRLTDSTDAAQRQGHKLGCSLAGNMMELSGAAGRNHPTWSPNVSVFLNTTFSMNVKRPDRE